jgi:hypothetical protein
MVLGVMVMVVVVVVGEAGAARGVGEGGGEVGEQAGQGEEQVDAALFELHVQGEHAAVVEGAVGGGLADEVVGVVVQELSYCDRPG